MSGCNRTKRIAVPASYPLSNTARASAPHGAASSESGGHPLLAEKEALARFMAPYEA